MERLETVVEREEREGHYRLSKREPNLFQRFALWMVSLAKVEAIPPGRDDDGLIPVGRSGTSMDPTWSELELSLNESRDAWLHNPMIRRLVGMTTSYVVGPGIMLTSEKPELKEFIEKWWKHPENRLDLRVPEWCDELTRSGELFPALFTNPVDGMTYVRAVPASLIEAVDFNDDDYEMEYRYKEATDWQEPDKWWLSNRHKQAWEKKDDGSLPAWMLHYAINRPVGMVRGQGDYVSILRWVRRYERWLEDRVKLNAAIRSFYWVVYASRNLTKQLRQQYRRPPEAGSIVVAEEGGERWEAVAPNLNARDAKEDGRAIRWMIVSGGPGTSLVDLGEGEESGLTKGSDADEQRRRFLLRRQLYFSYILSDMAVQSYHRYVFARTGKVLTPDEVSISDVVVKAPDISTEDNRELAAAVLDLTRSLTGLRETLGDTPELRNYALRLYVKYSGEQVTSGEFHGMLQGDPLADARALAGIEGGEGERRSDRNRKERNRDGKEHDRS